ncbi:MAG: pyruvate kinase [Verrucomicrobia bacterium]|nr:pyruvate kinase [Verrucomicrobiota bacterium]
MRLPKHKTKIVATIGPASARPEVMRAMIEAGMSVARLNFSHGDFGTHARNIVALREAAVRVGRPLALLADLPGPKLRLGELNPPQIELRTGADYTLTAKPILGDARRASVAYPPLFRALRPGDLIYINDGLVALRVEETKPETAHCRVVNGGEIRSRKGLNAPGLDLGPSAFTERDRECLRFALDHGVEILSQSFVGSAEDIRRVRQAAAEMGKEPFLIAKIERRPALDRLEEIIEAADGAMVARGDLGVETPLESMAIVQKRIISLCGALGRPVITATQMLESMVASPRPTRAEATDVANAILDGTDAVMLSAESAAGAYPVESVRMLARIAAVTEPHRRHGRWWEGLTRPAETGAAADPAEAVASNVEAAVEMLPVAAVFAPTASGRTARLIARLRLPVWTIAISAEAQTRATLLLSSGVWPTPLRKGIAWPSFARRAARAFGLHGRFAVLVEGPSPKRPRRHYSVEYVSLEPPAES